MKPITKASLDDSPVRSPREEIIATFSGDAFSPDRSLTKMWNNLLQVVRKSPEVAREEFEHRGIIMPLLHWVYFKKCPVTVFQAVHDAYPKASRHPVLRRVSNLQVTLLQDAMYRLNSNCLYTRWELNILEILIKSYPEALTIPTWRTYYDSPYETILFHPQEKIRKHLLPVAQVHLCQKLGQTCTKRGGEMLWKDHFPVDIIEHLVSLHHCGSLALVVHQDTTRLRPQIRFEICSSTSSYSGASALLRIVLLGNEPHFKIHHLSTLSVPLVSVTANIIMDDGREYQAGTINAFVMTQSLPDLRELSIMCRADTATQLDAFVGGLKHVPNVMGPSLNLVCTFACGCSSKDDDDNYSSATNSIIASLGDTTVRNLQFWFMDALPHHGVAEMLRRSRTLQSLRINGNFLVDNVEVIADALKTNTSLKVLRLDFYLRTIAAFLPIVSFHNFTLEQLDATKTVQQDSRRESLLLLMSIRHYCDLNKAGRKSLRGVSADAQSAVLCLQQHAQVGDVQTLYGLLRFRPDLWSDVS